MGGWVTQVEAVPLQGVDEGLDFGGDGRDRLSQVGEPPGEQRVVTHLHVIHSSAYALKRKIWHDR